MNKSPLLLSVNFTEAEQLGEDIELDQARELVYGMPYSEWKSKYQTEASADKLATFDERQQQENA